MVFLGKVDDEDRNQTFPLPVSHVDAGVAAYKNDSSTSQKY